MARMSNFSIATGDFKMLSGTFDAVTTTAVPNTACVANATCTFDPSDFTSNSCGWKPTEENTNVNGNLVFVRKTKLPDELVMVPAIVPFTCTLTSGNGNCFSWSVTRPETSMIMLSCAKMKLLVISSDKAANKFLIV